MADTKNTKRISEKRINERSSADTKGLLAAYGYTGKGSTKKTTKKK